MTSLMAECVDRSSQHQMGHFFSNHPHELNRPNNELWIGVNLGIDWYVPCFASPNLNNLSVGFLTYKATLHHLTYHVPPHSRSVIYHPNSGTLYYVIYYMTVLIF